MKKLIEKFKNTNHSFMATPIFSAWLWVLVVTKGIANYFDNEPWQQITCSGIFLAGCLLCGVVTAQKDRQKKKELLEYFAEGLRINNLLRMDEDANATLTGGPLD